MRSAQIRQPVSFSQNVHMMTGMADDDERHCPGAGRIAVDQSHPRPGLVVEVREHVDVAGAKRREFVHQLGERNRVVAGDGGVVVLLEPGQRLALAPGEAQGPVAEDPLAVDDMAEHLARRPFVRVRIGIRPAARSSASRRDRKSSRLGFHRRHDIALPNQRDVAFEMGEVLRRCGSHRPILREATDPRRPDSRIGRRAVIGHDVAGATAPRSWSRQSDALRYHCSARSTSVRSMRS